MPEIVTLSTDAQLREAIDVHHAVHGDPVPVWEEFLDRHPRWSAPGAHRAVVEDGRIVALTSVAMWEQRFGATTLPAAEIGLVGTLPAYRGRGHSRALMESWLESLRAEHIPISFLIGIPGFYERWAYHYAAPDHANHFLSIGQPALERAAEAGGTTRAADPDRDVPAITALVAAELGDTPGSPVLDEAMIRYFLARADAHGVEWRVIEAGGTVTAVVRHKRWDGGIGPQASGAVSLVAARPAARPAVAALLLEHLRAGEQDTLPLAIAPHSPFAEWLHLRGAARTCDRSIFPGGYAAMYRINDLAAVLAALRSCWNERELASRFAGHALTLRTGPDPAQVATIAVSPGSVEVDPGPGGVEIDAPPAVTVPWVTGWRSAADWLDATPYPPLPGPAADPGDPTALPPEPRDLLRALFPQRHPYIGDTIQGA